jgi:hypothetical protein
MQVNPEDAAAVAKRLQKYREIVEMLKSQGQVISLGIVSLCK